VSFQERVPESFAGPKVGFAAVPVFCAMSNRGSLEDAAGIGGALRQPAWQVPGSGVGEAAATNSPYRPVYSSVLLVGTASRLTGLFSALPMSVAIWLGTSCALKACTA